MAVAALNISAAVAPGGRATPRQANLRVPLDIPLLLSGNFGELRRNHFHSGLDFKTQGRVGLAVYAAADGYVSRVLVSPWGFGRAVYITHPQLGLTTVYGHLNSFSTAINRPVRERQYADESFRVDIEFAPGELPVKRGELIGRSGNAGSSGGPHLHLDVRDASTGDALDPLEYYSDHIADHTPPEVRAVALYPREGIVNGASRPVYHSGAKLSEAFNAWGRVVPAVKAYDRMDGTANIYGVKRMWLVVDGDTVYRRVIDRSPFESTRAANTLVDFGDVVADNSWNMITLVPAANPLPGMVRAQGDGSLYIDRERDYKCEFILEDHYGNRSRARFTIHGVPGEIPPPAGKGRLLAYDRDYMLREAGATVEIPAGTFYDDVLFDLDSYPPLDATYSRQYAVGALSIPLASDITVKIPVVNDTLADKRRYTMVRYNGLTPSAVGSFYAGGFMQAKVNRMGVYAVMADTVAPKITPLQPAKWGTTGEVKYRISDNLSGVDTYRAELDGKWVLMELDGKSGTLSAKLDTGRRRKGGSHELTLTVTDACGNTATDRRTFRW